MTEGSLTQTITAFTGQSFRRMNKAEGNHSSLPAISTTLPTAALQDGTARSDILIITVEAAEHISAPATTMAASSLPAVMPPRTFPPVPVQA